MPATPAIIARQAAERRRLAARRREAARNGYRGPLTRADLAAQAIRRARTAS